ncbi:MAG: hypothetical protein WA001_04805 [Patescibacteria group bacterium]
MQFPSFRSTAVALFACAAAILPIVAHAQSVSPLVKGSSSTVYYNSSAGNRYFFPNESVFNSWYADFSNVAQVSDSQLAALPLSGNVTYRPGTTMVKITTDPKVYAVSRYGVLHWVATEDIAARLYGTNWNQHIADVPDEYFTNYIIGTPITDASQYSPSDELSAAPTPDENIRPANYLPPEMPTGTTSSTTSTASTGTEVDISLSASQAVLNQMVSVNATVSSTFPITRVEIHSSTSAMPLQTCYNATNCNYSFTVSTAPQTSTFYAVAYDSAGKAYTTPTADQPTLMVASASNLLQVTVSPQSVTAGSRASFTSTVTNPPTITDHAIYAVIPGEAAPVLWFDCNTSVTCASSSPFYRNTYLYSQITTGGQTLVSPETLVQVTSGSAPKPTLAVTGKPATDEVEITLTAPFGETIGQTMVKDGTTLDSNTLAICTESTCVFDLQVNVAGSITAFTLVGGKYEASNVITVTPE